MCNLFENKTTFRELVDAFANWKLPVVKPAPQSAPNLQSLDAVRPTDEAPVIRAFEDGVELTSLRWGFVPERANAGPITNFRSEGRRFGAASRCLIPATAFFEFTGAKYPKTRWRFTETEQPWFCLAGLWRDDRFTLLTTEPGPDMAPYHDRQVVLLPRRQWSDWLEGAPEADLLRAGPAGSLGVVKDSPGREVSLPLFAAL